MQQAIIRVREILKVIKDKQLPLNTEKELQSVLEDIFKEAGIELEREYRLDKLGIIDFYDKKNDVGIEVKIKGSKRDTYSQCLRYCDYEKMKALILVTNKAINLPIEHTKEVRCYIFSLGITWL